MTSTSPSLTAATVIDAFTGAHAALDNDAETPFVWGERFAPTAAHHAHAARTLDWLDRMRVYAAETPAQARSRARSITPQRGWHGGGLREDAMRSVLAGKFSDPSLREVLLSTGDALLVHGGDRHHDQEWGDCSCPRHHDEPGSNLLGRALMDTRSRLRSGQGVPRLPRVALHAPEVQQWPPAPSGWLRGALADILGRLSEEYATAVAVTTLVPGVQEWWVEAAARAGLAQWAYLSEATPPEEWAEEAQRSWEAARDVCERRVVAASPAARDRLIERDVEVLVVVPPPGAAPPRPRRWGPRLAVVDPRARQVALPTTPSSR